jgi:hypothetical protein
MLHFELGTAGALFETRRSQGRHTLSSNPFRVFLVFVSFALMALGGLWVAGGRPTELSVEVRSTLSSEVLSHRFIETCGRLRELTDAETSSEASRRIPLHGSLTAQISVLGMIGLPQQMSIPLVLPFADIVYSSEPSGQGIVDPAIVFTDTKFFSSDAMELEWYGRDDQFIYLRELDANEHVRLVKLDPNQVEFSAQSPLESEGCLVRYMITLQHSGWQRFYGKLYTRTCEESARVRLAWICQQLESQPSSAKN